MAWVAIGAMAVSAGVSIMGANASAAAQRSAMAKQQADLGFALSFNEESTRLEQQKADIGFAQQFNQRLQAYNQIRSQQMAVAGYQGRTVDSMRNIMAADEKQWEYDTKVMEITNELNKKTIAISNLQSTLGMTNQINGLELSKDASKTAQTWNNIATVAQTGAAMFKYSGTKTGTKGE